MHRENIRLNTKIAHTTWTWPAAALHSKKLRYHLQSEWCSYRFLFIKRLIRLSHTNQIQYRYALDASVRNLFLKTPKYYTIHCYRKSFVFQQDRQTLVGGRRHSRLGPAFRAFHFLNHLILLLHDELQSISRNPCSAKMLLHLKIQSNVQWPGGSYWWLQIWRSRMSLNEASWTRSQFLTQSIFSTKFPHQLFVSSSCVERLAFLYVEVQDNIWIYFTMICHRESLWHHSR
jgi:hypothetical protein